MMGWVHTILPVGFSSYSTKEAPTGVPGTSIMSVPTLMGERHILSITKHNITVTKGKAKITTITISTSSAGSATLGDTS